MTARTNRIRLYCGICTSERARRPRVVAAVEISGSVIVYGNPSPEARRHAARQPAGPDYSPRLAAAIAGLAGGGPKAHLLRPDFMPKSGRTSIHVHCDVHGDGEVESAEVAEVVRRAVAGNLRSAVLPWWPTT